MRKWIVTISIISSFYSSIAFSDVEIPQTEYFCRAYCMIRGTKSAWYARGVGVVEARGYVIDEIFDRISRDCDSDHAVYSMLSTTGNLDYGASFMVRGPESRVSGQMQRYPVAEFCISDR